SVSMPGWRRRRYREGCVFCLHNSVYFGSVGLDSWNGGEWLRRDRFPEQNQGQLPNITIQLRLMIECKFHQRVIAVDAQLLADVGAMRVDGAKADAQFVCDLLAGFI